ncbi:tetratricopeptide repeat protein [Candidatus Woesearchaeota archaeon]|nr:tetratricopeptide repeat protein [Candidatus Woesearchaeota archaeon]
MNHTQFLPFIGRNEALSVYHSLLSYRQQRNAVYYHASGGLGKTWVLKRLIEDCRRQPRWHIAPPEVENPIIDFFETANRSVGGLRHSIIDRLGWEFFDAFKKLEGELRSLETKDPTSSSVHALSRRVDNQFFLDFERAVQGKYVGLYFDTFEVAHTLRVGQWFLEFLDDQRTKRCLIAVAGRTSAPILSLPANVIWDELEPFTKDETREYCQEHGWKVTSDEVTQLCESTNGHPLLMDLMFYFRNANICSLQELLEPAKNEKDREAKKKKTEQAVVRMFTTPSQSVSLVIQDMAVLKRRFAPGIFDLRQQTNPESYLDLTDYETLRRRFLENDSFKELHSIVKYRSEGQVLTLHDEVLRMFEEHAWVNPISPEAPRRQWERLRKELREEVVEVWYPQQIETELKDQPDKQTLRRILIGEYLGYLLGFDPQDAGVECYRKYFAEAKTASDFELGELLLAEILPCADRLPERGYEIFREHAQWLSDTGQYESAESLYKFIAKDHGEPPVRRLYALANLGHTFQRMGRYTNPTPLKLLEANTFEKRIQSLDNAKVVYELGLMFANEVGNENYQNAFNQGLGAIEEAAGNWSKAKELYETSTPESDPTENVLVSWAQANTALAILDGKMGDYDVARTRCQQAIEALENYSQARPADIANAYFNLAQIERYDDRPETAQEHYEKAVGLGSGLGDAYRAKFLQGRGTNLFTLGQRARENRQDIAAIEYQAKAFKDLSTAVELCDKSDTKLYLADALRRLGSVYIELHALRPTSADETTRQRIGELIQVSTEFSYSSPEYEYVLIGVPDREFEKLDLLEKAQRLYEISYLEADALNQYHESFEGLTHAASIALRLKRSDEVKRYAEYCGTLHGAAYHEYLYNAVIDIIQAHLDFDEGYFEKALNAYIPNYLTLAEIGGYALRIFHLQARELEERLRRDVMPIEQRKQFLQRLESLWSKTTIFKVSPKLIFVIRSLLKQLR